MILEDMHTLAYILAAVAVVGAIVSTIAATPFMQAQNETGNETITTEESGVITLEGNETEGPITLENGTVTEEEEPEPEPQTNVTGEPEPEPEVLLTNPTEGPFNITATQEPDEATITVTLASLTDGGNNVTVIEPDGNITEIPDVNVTVVDNDTVVITPPAENVTTIPENNVTIITPAPEPCDCPPGAAGEGEALAPVIVRPAPGQEVTIEGGTVTVENDTGVVVEGIDNVTAPS